MSEALRSLMRDAAAAAETRRLVGEARAWRPTQQGQHQLVGRLAHTGRMP